MHSHTYHSLQRIPFSWLRGYWYFQDASLTPRVLVKVAKRRGLTGIALCNHDTSMGSKEFHYWGKKTDLLTISGQEITKYFPNKRRAKQWGHILAYGVENIPMKIRFAPMPEFIEWMEEENAVIVLAHPFDLSGSAPAPGYSKRSGKILLENLKFFSKVETHNGFQPYRNNLVAQAVCNRLGLPGIGGSDSHHHKMVGRCYTEFEENIETTEDLLEILRKNRGFQPKGFGSQKDTWEYWFISLGLRYEWNLRRDLHRHLSPSPRVFVEKDLLWDYLFYDAKYGTPMKIWLLAAIKYLVPFSLLVLDLQVPRMLNKAYKREQKILKYLKSLNQEIFKRKQQEIGKWL